MSVRLRIFSNFLAAILVFNVISIAAGFLLFWFTANPYIGDRLAENAEQIAARYFMLGGFAALLFTCVGAIWIISVTVNHITGPLRRLKTAASRIRDGDLSYELVVSGHDEFAELTACFEQMRIRLKDTMYMQEKSENERRAMMAAITHDLNTPITSIMGYAEGIMDGIAATPERMREYAEVICKKARSLQFLSEDLSLLSRLENAQLPLDKRDEDIGALVSELTTEFFRSENASKLDINLASNLHALIDREKFSRILLNLYQNSVKYKKPEQPGCELTITLTKQGDANGASVAGGVSNIKDAGGVSVAGSANGADGVSVAGSVSVAGGANGADGVSVTNGVSRAGSVSGVSVAGSVSKVSNIKDAGGVALLTVSDNGIRVAQSDIPHLFDQFYRADSSRGKQSGSGLGLSITRQLVRLHGGKVWVLGNSGGGLSVNIALPLLKEAPNA